MKYNGSSFKSLTLAQPGIPCKISHAPIHFLESAQPKRMTQPEVSPQVPKPFLKSDFTPAVLDPSTGKTYTGPDHLAALQAAEEDGVHNLGQENTGFLHKSGTFYTRAQTDKEWGFMTSEELK